MISGRAFARLVKPAAVCAAAVVAAGCGTNYRPVISPVANPGPPSQPESLVAVVSSPAVTSPGIVTIVDYAGDTILAQAPIGPGPSIFSIDEFAADGYTLDSDGTVSNFPISTTLQAKNVNYSTLVKGFQPLNFFTPNTGVLFATDLSSNAVDVFSGFPIAYQLSVPVAPTPVIIAGSSQTGQRYFVLSQGNSSGGNIGSPVSCNNSPSTAPPGEVDSIESASYTVSARIPAGRCPVYAVESPDNQRVFVLNRGDDTVTVINAPNNGINSCTPFTGQLGNVVTCHAVLPLSLSAVQATGVTPPNGTAGMGSVAGPVFAEYSAAASQLVIANYDGSSVTVIDVSLDEYGNDSATFGTTYTIPVGKNPASVTVLGDGSRAYTADQTSQTVSIVNLTSHTLEKSLPVAGGHPRTVVNTQNSLYGKVYAASPDSDYLTIVRTDLDIVDTTVLVEGDIVDVRVSTQNASKGNSFVTSRVPGYGQPCNLPGAANSMTLSACAALP